MGFQAIYTAAVVVLMTIFLVKELIQPAITVFVALILLVFAGVISTDEAIHGFSNEGMLTVAFLFVVSGSLRSSAALDRAVGRLLGDGRGSAVVRCLRLMVPASVLSAFINNTPIVAALIPLVKAWCRRFNVPASKLLIPLSYAVILGGMCTLIGTSTNLVVHGLMLDYGAGGFSFFELTKAGLPAALIGILYVAFVGQRLLPSRDDPLVQLGQRTREFVVEMKVSEAFPGKGGTVEEVHLRHLQGLFLFQINRGNRVIAPVSHDERILVEDRLFFTGLPSTIVELQKTPGLTVVKDPAFDIKNIDSDELATFEAVVSTESDLVGRTVRDSNFRSRFDAVILAIHRAGSRIASKVGDIVFRPGDTLFILAKKGFNEKWHHERDFVLVTSSVEIYAKPRLKSATALILILAMILLAAFNVIPIVLAAACTALLLVLLRIVGTEGALKSIDWTVLIIIASSLGIGRAIQNSGLATFVATHAIEALRFFGPAGIIAGVFFMTSLYTELITNVAAAAIMFPITASMASLMDMDLRPLLITLAIAASSSFSTPVGYQTNLMVYGPGGYRFTDFTRAGILLNLLVGATVTASVYAWFFVMGWR